MVKNQQAAEAAQVNLEARVAGLRIGARPHVIVSDGRSFEEILVESSRDADLVFMGIAEPTGDGDFPEYYTRLQRMADPLPAVIFTLAA